MDAFNSLGNLTAFSSWVSVAGFTADYSDPNIQVPLTPSGGLRAAGHPQPPAPDTQRHETPAVPDSTPPALGITHQGAAGGSHTSSKLHRGRLGASIGAPPPTRRRAAPAAQVIMLVPTNEAYLTGMPDMGIFNSSNLPAGGTFSPSGSRAIFNFHSARATAHTAAWRSFHRPSLHPIRAWVDSPRPGALTCKPEQWAIRGLVGGANAGLPATVPRQRLELMDGQTLPTVLSATSPATQVGNLTFRLLPDP